MSYFQRQNSFISVMAFSIIAISFLGVIGGIGLVVYVVMTVSPVELATILGEMFSSFKKAGGL